MKEGLALLNSQRFLIIWLLTWIVAAVASPIVAFIYIPISVLVLKAQGRDWEVFIGFLFLLILSDSRQPVFEFAKTLKNAYILLLTLFYFMDMRPTSGFNLVRGFIPFFVIALIMLSESPTASIGFQKTVSYGLVLMVVPAIYKYLLEKDLKRTLDASVALFIFVLSIGLLLRVINPVFVMLEGRFSGIFGNPNGLGVYAAILFVFFTVLVDQFKDEIPRFLRRTVYVLLMISVILCGSRNALFSILLFLGFRRLSKLSPAIAFMLFVGIAAGYTYLLNNLVELIINFGLDDYFRVDTLLSGSGREIAWDFAIENIEEDPYMGRGFNYTEYLFKQNYDWLSMLGHQGNAHNSYMTFWLDTGVFGLIAFAIPFLAGFFRRSGVNVSALPALFLILFSANFESWLTASLNPMTSMVWMTIAVLSTSRDDLKIEESEQELLDKEEQDHQLQNGIVEK